MVQQPALNGPVFLLFVIGFTAFLFSELRLDFDFPHLSLLPNLALWLCFTSPRCLDVGSFILTVSSFHLFSKVFSYI